MATHEIKYMDKDTLTLLNQQAIEQDLPYWADFEQLSDLGEDLTFPVVKIDHVSGLGMVLTVLISPHEYVEIGINKFAITTFLQLPVKKIEVIDPQDHVIH